MGVHEGHRERLRKRFLAQGLESFDEHTALELLLFYARPRCDTNELAHTLLKQFGSISAVMDAPVEELETVPGVGGNSAVLLKMIPQMAAYYLNSRVAPGVVLNTTEKAGAYFIPKFYGKQTENLYMAALDDKRKVLRCVNLEQGGIVNAVQISVKKIVAEALKSSATSVLLAHNHPSGVALPSASDKLMTRQAYRALRLINVELADHIIVADDDFVSMGDSGFIDLLRGEEL